MIRIALERSPQLERLTRSAPELVRRAGLLGAKRAAEDYADAVRDWISAGRAFTPRTGLLEQSIGWRPLPAGAEVYAGGATAPYARYVERGTQAHTIAPKPGRQALRFFAGGGQLIRRSVNHPGTKPMPFFFADLMGREARMAQSFRAAVAEVLLGGRA